MSDVLPDLGHRLTPSFAQASGGLPPGAAVGIEEVRAAAAASGRVLVVIDDDPTGTQTVADVPLVTSWSVDDLRWGLTRGRSCLFVLANTRSLRGPAAAERVREIVRAAEAASVAEGVPYVIVSRGDSTLRGHFPLETDVVAAELESLTGRGVDAVVLCPAYLEAGRVTAGDVHWARIGEEMRPVGETEYARDPAFGYSSSDLKAFVDERSGGRFSAGEVLSISLETIRHDGVSGVIGRLGDAHGGRIVIVNAVTENDLRTVVAALATLEGRGRRFLYRTGPSFVRVRAGLAAQPPLQDATAIYGGAARGGRGVIVVGSHVPLTSRQIERARVLADLTPIELDVRDILARDRAPRLLEDVTKRTRSALESGDVMLFTSRDRVDGDALDVDGLGVAARVSQFLVQLTRRVFSQATPAFCVAKGGITSSDLATDALGVRRAWIAGSLEPGLISVWRPLDGPGAAPPFVVFAGNVGTEQSLANVITKLRGETTC